MYGKCVSGCVLWYGKVKFWIFFPPGGFPPLFSPSRKLSSACASRRALIFLLLDCHRVGKGPKILPSEFHPNRWKTEPTRENPRIRVQRQHYSFSFSRWNQALVLVWNGPETLPSKSHPNRLKTKPTRDNQIINSAPYGGNTAFFLLIVKSSMSLGLDSPRDTTLAISSKSVEN